jgi:hypothetical protein
MCGRDLSFNNLTVIGRNMLNGIDYFPTTVNLSANMIETVDEDSGFENWKLTCSEAQGRIKFL